MKKVILVGLLTVLCFVSFMGFLYMFTYPSSNLKGILYDYVRGGSVIVISEENSTISAYGYSNFTLTKNGGEIIKPVLKEPPFGWTESKYVLDPTPISKGRWIIQSTSWGERQYSLIVNGGDYQIEDPIVIKVIVGIGSCIIAIMIWFFFVPTFGLIVQLR